MVTTVLSRNKAGKVYSCTDKHDITTTEISASPACVFWYVCVPNHMDHLNSSEPNPANPLFSPGKAINSSGDNYTYSPSDPYSAWPNICHVVHIFLTADRKCWAPISGPLDPSVAAASSKYY